MHLVLSQASAQSTTPTFDITNGPIEVFLLAAGDFNGGLLFLDLSADGQLWIPIGTMFRPSILRRTLPDETKVRLRFVGGTNPSVSVWSSHAIPSQN